MILYMNDELNVKAKLMLVVKTALKNYFETGNVHSVSQNGGSLYN
jgi:hypothetical protein